MGQYTNKGLYNSYDKNHAERDKFDYYATKPGETLNILEHLRIDFSNKTILEPCAGGGHMLKDIYDYANIFHMENVKIGATDFQKHDTVCDLHIGTGDKFDFLSDDYPIDSADWVIMNPPFATIEPFTIRALEIAKEGLICLARLQFLEGIGRFDNIFSAAPPTDVWVYIDRIQCWKDGIEPSGSSAQAYAWFIWDKKNPHDTTLHWIRSKS